MSDSDDSVIRIRRSSLVTPLLVALSAAASTGAFTFAWRTSADLAVLKAQQQVSPERVAKLETLVAVNQEREAERRADLERELERLRSWMRNHRHGGQMAGLAMDEPPAPAAVPR